MLYPWGEYQGYFGEPPAAVLSDGKATVLEDGTLKVTHPVVDDAPEMLFRVTGEGECQARKLLPSGEYGPWYAIDSTGLDGTKAAAYFAWRSSQISIERQYGCADLRREALGFDPRRFRDVVVFVHSAMRQALFDPNNGSRDPLWDEALNCCLAAGSQRQIVQTLEQHGFRISVQASAW